MATVTYRTCDRCGEQISNIARSSVIYVRRKETFPQRTIGTVVPEAYDLCNACTNAFYSFTQEGGRRNHERIQTHA